jgi:hypothetical protein
VRTILIVAALAADSNSLVKLLKQIGGIFLLNAMKFLPKPLVRIQWCRQASRDNLVYIFEVTGDCPDARHGNTGIRNIIAVLTNPVRWIIVNYFVKI